MVNAADGPKTDADSIAAGVADGRLPVGPPGRPVVGEGGGPPIHAPKATVIVDSREQIPFSFARFRGWFQGVRRNGLKGGPLPCRARNSRRCSRGRNSWNQSSAFS